MTGKSSIQNTHIVFLQDYFYLGGIEILELKLARYFLNIGAKVTIACRSTPAATKHAEGISLFNHEGYTDLIERADNIINEADQKIIFVTLHPTAVIAALASITKIRRTKSNKEICIFHWVSHSRAFFFSDKNLIKKLFKKIFFLLPYKSTYFMNEAALLSHQKYWNADLGHYPIVRIVGREAQYFNNRNHTDCLRIVSVGRLVPFKSYNTYIPKIVNELLASGINVTWDIWGYGKDQLKIQKLIEEFGLTHFIQLRGSLPHENFDETVSTYDIFVGMGTAVLEAGKTRTPSIVALENGADLSYGFLFEAPSDSVGDHVPGHPQTKILDCIQKFSTLSKCEKNVYGNHCAKASESRESFIEVFATEVLESQPAPKFRIKKNVVLYIAIFYLYLKSIKMKYFTK